MIITLFATLLARMRQQVVARPWLFVTIVMLSIGYMMCLPRQLFQTPTSSVIEDAKGNLLGAKIANDGQWRFPAPDSLPAKYIAALTLFEDRRFFYHPGIDPISIARAIGQNLKKGKVFSGASTLTMQVIRLSRPAARRHIFNKLWEAILATRLEWRYSKKTIMALYAANAPFGGNVVGIEAATWRYYGKPLALLTWAEAATLAVLPNSPSLIHPGRNQHALLQKRNRLLRRLYERGDIDSLTWVLALEEPLPAKPLPLPNIAPHLLHFAQQQLKAGEPTRCRTWIDGYLQERVQNIMQQQALPLAANEIYNMAIMVMEVPTGNVVAYVGNMPGVGSEHAEQVDIIQAPRSTGSTLKPLLYALMLQEGSLLPTMLIPDIPTQVFGYEPENFLETYDGVIPARRALTRSLNIPFVRLLQQYGTAKFHYYLQQLQFKYINRPPEHYGLSLILGGAETSLWDLTNTYACLARMLGHYYTYNGKYDPSNFRPPRLLTTEPLTAPSRFKLRDAPPVLTAAATWLAFDAMKDLERPTEAGNWELFQQDMQVAWKTGTSFGFRDAWAVGVTPRYAVGVWVGNADGEGRPGLMGISVAAPILFEVFRLLPPAARWFDAPYDELQKTTICKYSGYRPLENCPIDTILTTKQGVRAAGCPYHQLLHLDSTAQWQVNAACESPAAMRHTPWFVLPPLEEYYYKSNHPEYVPAPAWRADCQPTLTTTPMQLIYPSFAAKIYVPLDINGQPSKTIFKAVHRDPQQRIYWHWDEQYLGSTRDFHHWALNPPYGVHRLTLVDEQGNRLEKTIEILANEKGK